LEQAAPSQLDETEADQVEPAEIEERAEETETPIEKLAQRSRQLPPEKIKRIVMSLLFVVDKPVGLDQLHQATGIDRQNLKQALDALAAEYQQEVNGVVLQEVAGGFQLRTNPESSEYVRRLLQAKPQRLTRAAVETLSIIAYRQPVTRAEVEDIRGVDSAAVIKALLERRMVRILGKKEEIGRPLLYGTSREFLEVFGLKDLASLPTLREFQELSKEHQEIVEQEAPGAPEEPTAAELDDPQFEQRLETSGLEAEGALAELEKAIATADQRAKNAAEVLAPTSPPNAEPQKPS
jgi:segregation and condensation protein B